VGRDDRELTIVQQRFTYLADAPNQQWLVPLSVRLFYADGVSKTVKMVLEDDRASIDIDEDVIAYKVNDGQIGFYRVKYRDEDNLRLIGGMVRNKDLKVEDRWGVQSDLYALVRRGDAVIEDYLDFLANYENEDDSLPISGIAGNLHHAYLVLEGQKEKIASMGRTPLESVLARVGYEPTRDERHSISNLRDQILWQCVLYGSKDVESFALKRFSALLRGEAIHPDIVKSVMQIGAAKDPERAFEWLDSRLQSTDSEHERMNILTALGRFAERTVIEQSLKYVLDEVPHRNKFIPIGAMAGNPYAIPYLWEWFVSNLEELERFHPVHYERVIAAIVPISGLGREDEVNAFFESYIKQKGKAKDAIQLSLERLQINARMRKRNACS
jgi:aminopeptidase N